MQVLFDLTAGHAHYHPGMQQIIERGPGGHLAAGLLLPITQQFAFAPGEDVVPPALVMVAPVIGFVDEFRGGAGYLPILDQPHLHFIDTAREWAGVEALQAGVDHLGVDQQAIAVDLHGGLTIGRDVHGINTGFGLCDCQAVGAAVHHPQCGVGVGAKSADLPGQTLGGRGEIAQA